MVKRARLVKVKTLGRTQGPPLGGAFGATTLLLLVLAAGCGVGVNRVATNSPPAPTATVAPEPPTTDVATTTTAPCLLPSTPGTANTIPVNEVCSSSGAPHFETPDAAMTYLASAWNSNNVRELDYVTNPAGRAQMNSMAALMVNLQFKSCTENPAGDYTCYFNHDIAPSTSPTTYPNPAGFPPGEAVFTVAPAIGPGWYLTNVIHCG
jgi:hypothetical protein